MNRQQPEVIDYLREENRVLREQLGGRRLRLADNQRRRLAVKGKALGRKLLGEIAGIVTPDTILRWYRRFVARKYDGSEERGPGRPRTSRDIADLLVMMAKGNPTWGYTRLRGAVPPENPIRAPHRRPLPVRSTRIGRIRTASPLRASDGSPCRASTEGRERTSGSSRAPDGVLAMDSCPAGAPRSSPDLPGVGNPRYSWTQGVVHGIALHPVGHVDVDTRRE